ncbi:methyltransferase domain-containing protein [Tritonibacter mobilis]|uniref:methyltransferase domain-containing protein n=1 Tax=Tritonibacter mobilis TaxID=379347 RepID=UPI000806EFA1|nr:glycosyltransferase family 2 protein [Tritonibacter mobilis]
MIRNEQDIIEPFLRHTAALVDLVVVLDNCSTDASRDIITKTAQELGNIVFTDLPDQGYNQSETMTRVLQGIQSTVFADFVFLLDADEFLSASSKEDLLISVRRVRPMAVGLLPWATYVPDPTLSEVEVLDPLDRLTMRRSHELPQYFKAVLRMAGGFDPELKVEQGNHHILDGEGRRLPDQILNDLELLHFPLRSIDQLIAKGVIGWEANERRVSYNPDTNLAFQWKRLHDIAKNNQRPSAEILLQEALYYAQEANTGLTAEAHEHGLNLRRKFSKGDFAPADQLIAQSRSATSRQVPPLTLPIIPKKTNKAANFSNVFEGNWHWDNLFLDEAPIRYAIERFSPRSVLDLGCGNGLYPALYTHLGVEDVQGVDGIQQEATVLNEKSYTVADLQHPLDLGRKYDLVVCLEVLEHLDAEVSDTLFDSIERHAKGKILFSVAEPGQPGNGHINCKKVSEVLAQWAKRGWQPDLEASLGLRGLSSMSWFRRNIVLLNNTGETGSTPAAEALSSIGEFNYDWYDQSPGHRAVAFAEPFPKIPKGYGRVISRW